MSTFLKTVGSSLNIYFLTFKIRDYSNQVFVSHNSLQCVKREMFVKAFTLKRQPEVALQSNGPTYDLELADRVHTTL